MLSLPSGWKSSFSLLSGNLVLKELIREGKEIPWVFRSAKLPPSLPYLLCLFLLITPLWLLLWPLFYPLLLRPENLSSHTSSQMLFLFHNIFGDIAVLRIIPMITTPATLTNFTQAGPLSRALWCLALLHSHMFMQYCLLGTSVWILLWAESEMGHGFYKRRLPNFSGWHYLSMQNFLSWNDFYTG